MLTGVIYIAIPGSVDISYKYQINDNRRVNQFLMHNILYIRLLRMMI